MADQLFVNNATTTTRGHTSVTATAITVEDSTGFPTPTGGDWFIATLDGGGNYVEIVRVTAVTGNVWTVVRAQEGTTAKLWQPNSRIECRVTAGSLVQVNQNSLRSDLANTTDPLKGAALVGYDGTTLREYIEDKFNGWTTPERFGTTDTPANTVAASGGATSVTVGTLTLTGFGSFALNDLIGFDLDDGTVHWTTVTTGSSGTTVAITAALPSAASVGNKVYIARLADR